MKTMTAFLFTVLFSVFGFAGFQGYQGVTNLGLFQAVKCSTGLTCSKVGTKLNIVTTTLGLLETTTAASAVSISTSQCGSTFALGVSTATQMGLPTATSAIIGCKLTFITAIASNFQINPDNGDQILVLTNASGDRISNTTLGNTVTLQAAAVSQWVVVGEKGTWADSN